MKKLNFKEILKFWFETHGPSDWYKKDSGFDEEIRQNFLDDYHELMNAELNSTLKTSEQALAAVIVLDQFSRNIFRDTPAAFEADERALRITEMMIEKGWDQDLADQKRHFVYMPYMHSEDLACQEKSLHYSALLAEDGRPSTWAVEHHRLIEKYGRFPHRNTILGRTSTEAEKEYLKRPDAGF